VIQRSYTLSTKSSGDIPRDDRLLKKLYMIIG
jgi:hypothetical protein